MAPHRQLSNAQQERQNTTPFLDPLCCSEDNWEDVTGHHSEEEIEAVSFFSNSKTINANQFVILPEHDLFWDDGELSSLLIKEEQNHLHQKLQKNPSLASARLDAVEWILKANACYSFAALTGVLAVNYLNRFLCGFEIQMDKPWMTQLVAVTCLSLAAKVEETHVPLLLDLQVESKYVFEARTIKRMEILVLSTLEWKMNVVTPLSFLDFISRRLRLKGRLCWEFLRRCERILLSIIRDDRFMGYLPSAIATATMLHVVNGIEPSIGLEYENQLVGILGIDKEKVEDCSKLIEELEIRGSTVNGLSSSKKRKYDGIPGSPKGVMEAMFSSDSSNDSWSVSPSPEPLTKTSRTQEPTDTVDVLGAGR